MTTNADLEAILAAASIDPSVGQLRGDYRVALLAADGLEPGRASDLVERRLVDAEQQARRMLAQTAVEELPAVAAWREAYRAFGAKPQRTRNSLEALLRRVDDGLPRINPLTDLYNAVSLAYQIPLGGEDLDRYVGAPRLLRSNGSEPFDTVAGGEPVVEYPESGEVIWRDEEGVTCRRWNWRQCHRTALTAGTRRALFILDVLDPISDEQLAAASDELTARLRELGDAVTVHQRVLRAQG